MERFDRNMITKSYENIRSENPWKHNSSNLFHHRVLPYATLSPWLNDLEFLEIYEKIKSHTLVDIYRCYELWTLAKQSIKVEGIILEIGVWRGGTGAIIAEATKNYNKKIFLADTFRGVVKSGFKDTNYVGGEHSDTSLELVSKLMSSLSLTNINILEGIFPDDTHQNIVENISMIHCDVDVYQSASDIIAWCMPRMTLGAILVFDDYGFYGCEGIAELCNEMNKRGDFIFIHNLNGHAIFIKIV